MILSMLFVFIIAIILRYFIWKFKSSIWVKVSFWDTLNALWACKFSKNIIYINNGKLFGVENGTYKILKIDDKNSKVKMRRVK